MTGGLLAGRFPAATWRCSRSGQGAGDQRVGEGHPLTPWCERRQQDHAGGVQEVGRAPGSSEPVPIVRDQEHGLEHLSSGQDPGNHAGPFIKGRPRE